MAKPKSKVGVFIVLGVLVAGCVPCTGIVAAIGLPAFIGYVRRSKTSEATSNLRTLYVSASAYYSQTHVGPDGEVLTGCTVGPEVTPNVPGETKQVIGPVGPSFSALGFAPVDPVFYQYEIIGAPSRCGVDAYGPVYTFRAHGDLDGDGTQSLFELSVGINETSEMYRAPGFFIENELE